MSTERIKGKNLLQQAYVSDKIGSPISADCLENIIELKRAEEEAEAIKKQNNHT